MAYSYETVYLREKSDETLKIHEFIVADSFEHVYTKAFQQAKNCDDEIIAIVRRDPIVAVLDENGRYRREAIK